MNTYTSWADTGIEFPHSYGDHFDTTCPQCSGERKASREKCLYVNVAEEYWFCHHCNWTGGLRKVNEWNGNTPTFKPKAHPKPPAKPSALPETGQLAPWAVEFFAARGIGTNILRKYDVRTDTIHNGKTEVIVIPFKRDGKIVTAKLRFRYPDENGKKRHEMEAGTEKIPFGLDECRGANEIVIVEGEPDKFAIEQATGRTAVLSPPHGSQMTDAVIEAMVVACEDAHVILAGDMDENGEKMQAVLAERLGYARCSRAKWPCKDANDTLIEYGPDVLKAWLDDAKPYPIAGIFTIADIADDIDVLYDTGMPGGSSTGWPQLDRHYTVREGQLTIVTGPPGSGKSVWIDALLVNLAKQGWKVGVCSPEFQPLQRHAAHFMSVYIGSPFGAGPTPRMTRLEKDKAKDWLTTWCAFVLPEENTIDAVLARGLDLKRRMGINGFVIDPWTELDHTRPNGMTETEFIHQSLSKIRAFCRNHNVHGWVVAHPTKLYKGQDGKYPVATPYDISGSAGWFNKADNCLSMWRDRSDETLPVELHIQKIRFSEVGGLGMVRFNYNRLTGRYSEVA